MSDYAALERRVAVLESIHKLGFPTPDAPRHIASPTEQDLMKERDAARAAHKELYYRIRGNAPAFPPDVERWPYLERE